MINMDKEKYIKWYNLARDAVNDAFLMPQRYPEEIVSFVSREDWLGFADKDTSLEELEKSDKPNIFFEIENNKGTIGLTFNNVNSVDTIKNILNGFCKVEKEELIKKLLELETIWRIKVHRKIKEHHQSEKAEYDTVFDEQSNKIDEKNIEKIIKLSEEIRENGKRKPINKANYPYETPVITLMESDFELSEDEFKKRIVSAFDVLRTCLNVKTDSQIRRLEKEKSKLKPPEDLTKLWKR